MMKSKRILYFSFLLALLPVFLEWFRIGSPGIRPPCRGIYLVRGEFYFAVALYYVMLFLKKNWGIIAAHLLVVVSYIIAMSQFTVRMNLMGKPNLKYTMQRLKPTCWIAILAVIMHFIGAVKIYAQIYLQAPAE